jgi:sec-independent protein translocase protein TatC
MWRRRPDPRMSTDNEGAKPDEGPSEEQGFLSHLIELRQRLMRSAIAVLVVMIALTPFMKQIYDLFAAPLTQTLPAGTKLLATSVVSPFLVPLKATLLVAFVIALPVVLYQIWAFVAPGLYKHEKRLALPIIVSSFLMFLAGVAFCYFVVFRLLFPVIYSFTPEAVNFAPDIEAYFSFALTMFFAFGLTFETPIVLIVLTRLGMVTVAKLRAIRPYFIVGAFIVAAVVTPPDVTSQLLLAVPLVLLFELGILISALLDKLFPRAAAADAAEGAESTAEKAAEKAA